MTMGDSISPPPLKRQKTLHESHLSRTIPSLPLDSNDEAGMRVSSWNINGIGPFLQKPITTFFAASYPKKIPAKGTEVPPASLRGFLERHHWPAILFLQEVKIASSDTKTQDAVRRAVNTQLPSEASTAKRGPGYEAHFTLPNDPHNARGPRGSGKVYGVCSIIRSDVSMMLAAKVRTVDWDKEGRVSVVELESPTTKLALFNIYAVNGTDNPYRDPSTGAIRGTRHDRKLNFHKLLMQECIALQEQGLAVILAGDMNVAPDARDGNPRLRTFPNQHVVNRADFLARFMGGKKQKKEKVFDGVDIWRAEHRDERRYTYFPRGREWGSSCDRVDYAIADRESWKKGIVSDCGILDSKEERGPSDHVPIWFDINLRRQHEDNQSKEEVSKRPQDRATTPTSRGSTSQEASHPSPSRTGSHPQAAPPTDSDAT